MATQQQTVENLESAKAGFDHLFQNQVKAAKDHLAGKEDPFHLLGLGVCTFLEAALGMETAMIATAGQLLAQSESGAKRQQKSPVFRPNQRFPPGLEWEILNADAIVLQGLSHALSESYTGYLQCLYALNSLFKTVFPNGLDDPNSPTIASHSHLSATSLVHKQSTIILKSTTSTVTQTLAPGKGSGFFSRFTSSSTNISASSSTLSVQSVGKELAPDGPVEELIIAGSAFGYGLFNLVFSLLPKGVRSVVGFFGFKYDRREALAALAVAASRGDIHSIFSGLVLMTYHGVVLLMSGYQADEEKILKQYREIVDVISTRYPEGVLWILNRAKILRMSYDPEAAIEVLQAGLKPVKPHTFAQGDTLLVFELAWTLLGQRRYQEAADSFIQLTGLNNWSHGTYYFLAAGCYVSLGNYEKAQELLDAVPGLIEKRKLAGKDLPTEVLIKKRIEFYKAKQLRLCGTTNDYAQAMKISPAEELGVFWNTHSRISRDVALAHIKEWSALTPAASIPSPYIAITTSSRASISSRESSSSQKKHDLDSPDELALRSLLLGIVHRTVGAYAESKAFLLDAFSKYDGGEIKSSTWIGGVASFELSVTELKEAEWNLEGRESPSAASRSVKVEAGMANLKIESVSSEVSSAASSPLPSIFSTATTSPKSGSESPSPLGMKVPSSAAEQSSSSPRPSKSKAEIKQAWLAILKSAEERLDKALSLATSSTDLSSRLDSRIAMLRDEIVIKREMVNAAAS